MTFASLKYLPVTTITPEAFQPYGQVIAAIPDGQLYGPNEAQLDLQNGTPRFYIMRLYEQRRKFHKITRHRRCTQCLGSLAGKDWLIGVAPPGDDPLPRLENIRVFRVPGDCFIKLNIGTWHAGPFFDHASVDFYNLELHDTNVTDHDTCNLLDSYGVELEAVLPDT